MGWLKTCAAGAVLALAACGGERSDYPSLLPTDQVLAEPALPGHAADAATDPGVASGALDMRGRSLSARAGGRGTDSADLAARAEALRQRAEALTRRDPGDCPTDQPDCDTGPEAGADPDSAAD